MPKDCKTVASDDLEASLIELSGGIGAASQAFDIPDDLMLSQEQSPAYTALRDAGLIVNTYRLKNSFDLQVECGNASVLENFFRRFLSYILGIFLGGLIYDFFFIHFVVKEGHVLPGTHSDGTYVYFGPGVYRMSRLMWKVGEEASLLDSSIEHGNNMIITVPQGFVGLAFDRGQPTLLAPGLHQWKSDTLKMSELIDLSADVIKIGPFTLLTVDEGYAAITQNNGKQVILSGGSTHMLTHRNWKFEKYISLKIHTDDLGPFRATTADNVVLETTATVNWRVQDPTLAARMAADTMPSYNGGSDNILGVNKTGAASRTNHPALQRDVLKQAVASLAAAMGSIRYADDVHVAASHKVTVVDSETWNIGASDSASAVSKSEGPPTRPRRAVGHDEDACGVSQIFSVQQMSSAVKHANEICVQYGVSIISINVISAVPTDKRLTEALSAGAVASAGAQQAEIAARGNAKAKLISSQSEAEALRIQAQSVADAEAVQARGKKEAAALLETSSVAVDLARLEKTGQAIGDKASFFFGASPATLPSFFANPSLLRLDKEHDM